MKLEKKENNEKINIFQKYYLPKIKEETNKKFDYLDYASFLSLSNQKPQKQNDNLILSNLFKKIFYNSIIPYLSINDLISFKLINQMTNSFISNKAISICILSNSIKGFKSPKERRVIWNHFLKIDKYKSELFKEENNKFNLNILEDEKDDNNNIKGKDILYYNISVKIVK